MGKGVNLDSDSPIQKGTNLHKAVEEYYTKQPISELSELNRQIFDHYVEWAKVNDDFEVVSAEYNFSEPFYEDHLSKHTFNGRLDLVTNRNDKLWINDFKFTSLNFDNYTDYIVELDEQSRAYSWVARELWGDLFGGFMFTLVRSKPPEPVKILKNGQLSKDKSQQTTWEIYKRAVLAMSLQLSEYEDMEAVLPQFIRRIHVKRYSDRALDMWYKRNVEIAKEMMSESLSFYPNPSIVSCRGCAFKHPCHIANNFSLGSAIDMVNCSFVDSDYAMRVTKEREKVIDG